MSSQDVFWFNAALGGAFMALFLIRKGQRAPTRLNMRAGAGTTGSAAGTTASRQIAAQKKASYKPRLVTETTMSPEAMEGIQRHPKEKILNVLFIYNGHTWDAYEVLGLPAGAPLKLVEEAYHRASAKTAAGRREFIDSAYQSIRSQALRSSGF